MLAASGQDSGSPIIPICDPKSVGASAPSQWILDVGGGVVCGSMSAFCPTITTKLAASCPLALRNNPHLMLSTWAWLSGWTNVPQEQLCSGYKKQTAREFGYMSECERRLMTWFKMELGLVCDFTSVFYCVFMSTDFFIHVLDHSSPSFSHDGSFFPCLFPCVPTSLADCPAHEFCFIT